MVDADEGDIVAIPAVYAGEVRDAPPTRAPVSSNFVIGGELQVGRISNDAAGIVPSQSRSGAVNEGSGQGCAPTTRQRQRQRHHSQQIPTHSSPPRTGPPGRSLEVRTTNEKRFAPSVRLRASARSVSHSIE